MSTPTTETGQPVAFVQQSPATSYVLRVMGRVPLLPAEHRLTLFAVAALADQALHSGNGYGGHTATEIQAVTGRTLLKTQQALSRLQMYGMLDSFATDSGPATFKITQSAFDYANEV